MTKLLILLLTLGWTGSAVACTSLPSSTAPKEPIAAVPNDTIALPDLQTDYRSPNGQYQFVVSAVDGWQTPRAVGQLYSLQSGQTLLWEKPLPQAYGPRFAVVTPAGDVILFDEQLNIASPYAVMVLDAAGEAIAQHSFDDIQALLAQPRAEIVEQAAIGWWIETPPAWDAQLEQVRLSAAGTSLAVTSDGHLQLETAP
ncbi:MAG: hypothetical protein F6J97_21435 [Leptolyngbya sp. SIO4C1]|nr:hypothetical protein [Leptolyngbya sp. SIO4C1]